MVFIVFLFLFILFADSFQNMTVEERVTILESQVVEIEEDITVLGVGLAGLSEDVEFLFDDQVIQDERIFTLEQTSIETSNAVDGKNIW